MPRLNDPKTHFEQVPLEIVKKIAEEDVPDGKENDVGVPVKCPARK
jgi:hypothetical protein